MGIFKMEGIGWPIKGRSGEFLGITGGIGESLLDREKKAQDYLMFENGHGIGMWSMIMEALGPDSLEERPPDSEYYHAYACDECPSAGWWHREKHLLRIRSYVKNPFPSKRNPQDVYPPTYRIRITCEAERLSIEETEKVWKRKLGSWDPVAEISKR